MHGVNLKLTTVLFFDYYSRAKIFDSLESSSGPPRNDDDSRELKLVALE
jgi:hypothetical protein